MPPDNVSQALIVQASRDYLEAAEEGSGEISWLLREDDFVCTNLMFAEFDDDVGVQGIVEEWSSEVIHRRHAEVVKGWSNGKTERWDLRTDLIKSGVLVEEWESKNLKGATVFGVTVFVFLLVDEGLLGSSGTFYHLGLCFWW
jgi:hypothetical protein